jgi:hypothetical protein
MTALIKLKQIEPLPLALPVPHVVLAKQRGDNALPAYNPNSDPFTYTISGDKLLLSKTPLITVMDLPPDLLKLDLRLELLWFRKERKNSHGGGGNGYRHPSHFPTGNATIDSPTGLSLQATPLTNTRFRGGSGALSPRVSEWSVTKVGQKFFVDTLGHYFALDDVLYIDTTGSGQTVKAFVPTFKAASSKNASQRGYGYSARYRPNYFQFRYSVADPRDPRNRLVGPTTKTIVCTALRHPFVHDAAASASTGLTCNAIHGNYKENELNCWFSNRLPG